MLSFKTIATLATLAFGAMPVLAAPAPFAIGLEAEVGTRAVAPTSVPKILDNVILAVTPIVAELSEFRLSFCIGVRVDHILAEFITSENATVEAINPIVDQIKTIINGAIDDVNTLAGQPVEVILAAVEGTAQISTQELAKLVADLLNVRLVSPPVPRVVVDNCS